MDELILRTVHDFIADKAAHRAVPLEIILGQECFKHVIKVRVVRDLDAEGRQIREESKLVNEVHRVFL